MNANREERIASFVVAAFSLAYFVGAFLIPMPTLKQQMGPGFFPKGIGVGHVDSFRDLCPSAAPRRRQGR